MLTLVHHVAWVGTVEHGTSKDASHCSPLCTTERDGMAEKYECATLLWWHIHTSLMYGAASSTIIHALEHSKNQQEEIMTRGVYKK